MGSTKTSLWLLLLSVSCAMLLGMTHSGWSQEAKKANPRIRELQQKRLVVLGQVVDAARQNFMNARTTFEEVHDAESTLLAARLEYADTQEERIKACDEAIAGALKWKAVVEKMVMTGLASRIVELKAEAYLLETQIAREKLE